MDCREFNHILFDYIEGHLSLKQRRAIKTHLNHCTKCQTALSQYESILAKLHRLPKFKCPDAVIDRVFESVNVRETKTSLLFEIYQRFSERLSWKVSFAAVIIIILMISLFYPRKEKKDYEQTIYTAEEIEQAKKDVELALGYFHYYAKKTEMILEDQVFTKPLVKPIKSTIKKAFKPLLSGGKL